MDVVNHSPCFLRDTCHRWVDDSLPTEFRTRMRIKITIGNSNRKMIITPGFCFRHSKTVPTRFLGVDPWVQEYHNAQIRHAFCCIKLMWNPVSENGLDQFETSNLSAMAGFEGLNTISLPSIISDAIALCQALGERFLWVDRLYIVQDDEDSKKEQICAMDLIFNSATFTIMAALNSRTSDMGLPGCPGRPRLPSALRPRLACLASGHNLFSADDLRACVNTSLWNRRGWTFQERLLSRRRLFITESQVIFECTRYEELSYMPPHFHSLTAITRSKSCVFKLSCTACTSRSVDNGEENLSQSWSSLDGTWRLPLWNNQNPSDSEIRYDEAIIRSGELRWGYYEKCVRDYHLRHLARNTDVLNAFTGVGNVLARGLDTRMVFGLPGKYFTSALMLI